MLKFCQSLSRPSIKQLPQLRSYVTFQNTMNNTAYGKSLKYLIAGGAVTILGSILFTKSNYFSFLKKQLTAEFPVVKAKSVSSLTDLSYSQMLFDKKSAVFRIEVLGDAINKASLHSGVLIDSKHSLILSESLGEVGTKVKVTTADMSVMNGQVVAMDMELSLIQLEQPVSGVGGAIPVSESSCRLGQRVVSAGWDTKTGLSVCGSVVSSIQSDRLECILLSTNEHRGGALLNMDGELVGILGPKTSNQSAIGLSIITEFLKNNLPSIENN